MSEAPDTAAEIAADQVVADAMARCLTPLNAAIEAIWQHRGATPECLLIQGLVGMLVADVLCHARLGTEAHDVAKAIDGAEG